VNPPSLAGIARIEEPSENDARENRDGAAHSDVPMSGLASATGARLVRPYRCSFWATITLVSVAVSHLALSHMLDLEGQPVDLARGVWPLDVALVGHQLDLRLLEYAHVASLDGAAVVCKDVVGRFEQLVLDDDDDRSFP
jgi:hypothetical protein